MRTKPTKQEIVVLGSSVLCLITGWLTPVLHNGWDILQNHAIEIHAGIAMVGVARVVVAMVREEAQFCWPLYVSGMLLSPVILHFCLVPLQAQYLN